MTEALPKRCGEPKVLPSSVAHGTVNAYVNYRCGCGPCKDAHVRDLRRHRDRRLKRRIWRDDHWYHPDAPHGSTNGYTNYGCRCGLCRAAHAKAKTKRAVGKAPTPTSLLAGRIILVTYVRTNRN